MDVAFTSSSETSWSGIFPTLRRLRHSCLADPERSASTCRDSQVSFSKLQTTDFAECVAYIGIRSRRDAGSSLKMLCKPSSAPQIPAQSEKMLQSECVLPSAILAGLPLGQRMVSRAVVNALRNSPHSYLPASKGVSTRLR